MLVPEPAMAPGLIVHAPEGKPLRTTLPVARVHVGCVIAPTTGAEGLSCTINVYVANAAAHGGPKGLLVVTVIVTIFPASLAAGM